MKPRDPVKYIKREDGSLEDWETKDPDYISGEKSNPHAQPARKTDQFYTDHGRGTVSDESYSNEDDIQKGKVMKNGPKTDGSSTQIEEESD